MPRFCTTILQNCKNLLQKDAVLKQAGGSFLQQVRTGTSRPPYARPLRPRYPIWYLRKERAEYDEQLTASNKEFIKEVIHDQYGPPAEISGIQTYQLKSPLKSEPMARGEWNIKSRRTGLIVRKIGVYPMWTKKGKFILTTALQVVDNHVIKYIPPEEFNPPRIPYKCPSHKMHLACLLVGAESTDPQKFTKEYCGLFTKSGVMPKKILGRFLITPEAAIQPGTPLTACHFKVGAWVDVRGLTKPRGFQGVMRRWGFHGQPATHGQTKTHRRPGCIGGPKARVWPGKKMPGHMGYHYRYQCGLKILRINTKYNVIWVQGSGIPGGVGSVCYIYDSKLFPKRNNHHRIPHFPTFYPEDLKEPLPEDMYDEEIHPLSEPTISFADQQTK